MVNKNYTIAFINSNVITISPMIHVAKMSVVKMPIIRISVLNSSASSLVSLWDTFAKYNNSSHPNKYLDDGVT
ncbi:hypothetical protein [uncultured Maribacter sp.]|uniref:hypothetical protein n=1 Tax=uncultured Maribacter sp. TaxID=431308 RepID=UPI002638B4BF|nr:hypothetical protein [uncultured Maribacter sp.]